MSRDHPVLTELKQLCDYHNIDNIKAHVVFESYMQLCEVQKLWEVKHHFSEELKLFYISAKQNKHSEEFDIFIPLTSDETINMQYIELLQSCLVPDNRMLILVFKDRDSSSTYYRVTKGLVRPDSPVTATIKKVNAKKQSQFQKNLLKHRRKLYTNATESETHEAK